MIFCPIMCMYILVWAYVYMDSWIRCRADLFSDVLTYCAMLQAFRCYRSSSDVYDVRTCARVCVFFIGIVQRKWACLTWKSAIEIKSLLLLLLLLLKVHTYIEGSLGQAYAGPGQTMPLEKASITCDCWGKVRSQSLPSACDHHYRQGLTNTVVHITISVLKNKGVGGGGGGWGGFWGFLKAQLDPSCYQSCYWGVEEQGFHCGQNCHPSVEVKSLLPLSALACWNTLGVTAAALTMGEVKSVATHANERLKSFIVVCWLLNVPATC